MIENNQIRLNRLYMIIDALTIIAGYTAAYIIIFGRNAATAALPASIYITAMALIVPLYIILNEIFGLYTPKRIGGVGKEFEGILKANTIGFLIITLVLFLGSKSLYLYHFSKRLVLIFYINCIVFETVERNLIRFFFMKLRINGHNLKHILLVGYSRAAEGYIDRVTSNLQWGYKIMGILDNNKEKGYSYRNIAVIGGIDNLKGILDANNLDEIAITLGLEEYEHLEDIVKSCEKSGVHTKFIPDYQNIIPTIPYIEDLMGLPVINIRHVPLTRWHNAVIKRIVDIFAGITGLIIFSPLMIVIAVLIKLTSRGPVIFPQERVGLHNKPFKMYKFRSMAVQEKKKEAKAWTTPDDPRVTAVGRFIRKTSIDELPQFYNILIGNMSIVGPRPERPYYVEKFKEEIPHYMIKHQVRPGLTGWAQVNGFRGDTSIQKRIEHDLYYIENWTLGFDFKIMFLTIFKGFINKNAY